MSGSEVTSVLSGLHLISQQIGWIILWPQTSDNEERINSYSENNPDEGAEKVQVKLATTWQGGQYIHNKINQQYMDDHIIPNEMIFCHDKLNGPQINVIVIKLVGERQRWNE